MAPTTRKKTATAVKLKAKPSDAAKKRSAKKIEKKPTPAKVTLRRTKRKIVKKKIEDASEVKRTKPTGTPKKNVQKRRAIEKSPNKRQKLLDENENCTPTKRGRKKTTPNDTSHITPKAKKTNDRSKQNSLSKRLTPIEKKAKPLKNQKKEISDIIKENHDYIMEEVNNVEPEEIIVKKFVKNEQNWPSNRWGQRMTSLNNQECVMFGGQGFGSKLSKDSFWSYNHQTDKWQTIEDEDNTIPPARTGHAVVFDELTKCLYLIGGSKNTRWFSDVHVLDTIQWKWREVKYSGDAPLVSYHSATMFRYEIWVFAGITPKSKENPDECSNSLFVFNTLEELWYKPVTMGSPPAARSGHSADLINYDRLIIFGGWDSPKCFNDVHILDLGVGEWVKRDILGPPPEPRTWHASCSFSNKVFIHGGYNGDIALSDSFILDTNLSSWQWTKLNVPKTLCALTGHSCCCYESDPYIKLLIFGGGDNEGEFYDSFYEIRLRA
ncbi:DgyrCDS10470 [Dimorphilus gyrociliatus]|uniref:DgyrCDS10470 n=1 Tax=Dimorphilus gyrociliatus TaxID=2664684 RepID=A0A7I8W2A8_9ANNE|nr:DgyrCDS10470 [Dimorphilus gyrociliatus]